MPSNEGQVWQVCVCVLTTEHTRIKLEPLFKMASLIRPFKGLTRQLQAQLPIHYMCRYGLRSISTTRAVCSEYVIKSQFPDVEIPKGSFYSFTFKDAASYYKNIALECSETGAQYTYGQLVDATTRFGGFLQKMEVNRGDTVAVAMRNCIEYPIVFYGALAIGATVTVLSSFSTPEEHVHKLEDTQAKVLIGSASLEPELRQALQQYRRKIPFILNGTGASGDSVNLQEILKDPNIPHADPIEMNGDEIALIPFSSGTTGKPKGVCISHNALCAGLTLFTDKHLLVPQRSEGEKQENIIGCLPFFHIAGLVAQMTVSIIMGCKLITLPKFDPQHFLRTIIHHKARVLAVVPPMLNFLNSAHVPPEALRYVESILCGAAAVPITAVEILKRKIGHPIFFQEGYGMTELCLTHVTPIGQEQIGFCGKLVPNALGKVVDVSTGESLPANGVGEICIKTPAMMTGYLNRPDATSETIDSEGWLHTGDVGFYNEEGYFKIVDRTKELIKVKGLQVSPSEIEDVLLQHEAVQDVGVVGVPHDQLGEAPRAYIVLKKNVEEKAIHQHLEGRLATYKHLSGGVFFVNQLPKNPTGKLLRRELKNMTVS
ncbi:putative 4-coumarate--CoA ligase 3 [Oratosquilla oratoria]|uniref:putative 4-coumarate--CoA ligase 3 n=1 Tax=Oratosquilla oratoria TaxID=337810 RepID=UPI003F76323E